MPFDCCTLPKQARVKIEKAISKDQRIPGGEPFFRGSRVPFRILIDYLEAAIRRIRF